MTNFERFVNYSELYFGASIKSKIRTRAIVDMKRHMIFVLRLLCPEMRWTDIAPFAGYKDHSSPIHHYNKQKDLLETDMEHYNRFKAYTYSLYHDASVIDFHELHYIQGEALLLRDKGIRHSVNQMFEG